MKLLISQLTKRKIAILSLLLFSSFIFVAVNSFAIILLYTFVNILSNNGEAPAEHITIWDRLLEPLYTNPKLELWGNLAVLASVTIGLSLGAFGLRVVARIYIIRLTMEMMFNLRNKVYTHVIDLKEESFNKISPTSMVNRLNNDTYLLQDAAINYFLYFFESFWYVVLNIIFSLTLNVILSSIYLIFVPLAFCVIFFAERRADKYYENNLLSLDKTNQVVRENILGIRIVKSFNLQDHQYQRFVGNNKTWYSTIVKSEVIVMSSVISLFLILNVSIIVILLLGGSIVINNWFGGISVGVVVAFLNYVYVIVFNVFGLTNTILGLVRTRPVIRRIKEILNSECENFDLGIKEGTKFVPKVTFENVCFSYEINNQVQHLKDINLSIEANQTIGIIGPTGSGKSTLVSLIAKLHEPTSGEIKINDVNLNDINLNYLRNQIGFAPQEKLIFSGTIKSNLLHGKQDATPEQICFAAEQSCAAEFIEKLPDKYDNIVNQNGSNLSGGQRQRLSLARALIREPKILILDDTLSALDNLTRDKVLKNIKTNYDHSTKIIVSQQVKTIRHADQIFVMDKGQIVASGKHDELLSTCALYSQINASQQTIGEA